MIKTATENLQPVRGRCFSCADFFAALALLSKPGVVAAIALSGCTGMMVAVRGIPDATRGLACVTVLLLAAAGSAMMNCVMEHHLDEPMQRLARRNAALERAGTGRTAACAVLLMALSLAISVTVLGGKATLLVTAAILGYTVYYTILLKRHTFWAAVLGGVPGALPVLIGSAATLKEPSSGVLTLALIMLLWQPPHFWLLALSHRKDYQRAGVPVLPLVKGTRFTKRCILASVFSLLPASLLLYFQGPCSQAYALAALLLGTSFLLSCHYCLATQRYRGAFRGSVLYLLAIFMVIIIDLCTSSQLQHAPAGPLAKGAATSTVPGLEQQIKQGGSCYNQTRR